jgi:carnitine O-palmitoyltransferase 1
MIMTSYEEALAVVNNTDLHIYIHDLFGKKEFKRCKTSPDAFIQMALQLAYYTEFGRHDLTYESSMTRLFRYGRTETIRSCSIESCDWVKSMKNADATKEERLRLFKLACEYHQVQCRDAMCGRAVDRHMFSLYIISNYLKHDSPFLTEVLSQPWRLSTSQTAPHQAGLVDLNKHPEFRPLGGGFGPVNEDGYGVSYVFCDDNTITFHVSSKRSCDKTDSYRFGQQIRKSLMDIKGLFDN